MSDELDPLRKASAGLLYPSDTDAPFDVFSLPAAQSPKDALMNAGKVTGKVDEWNIAKFFDELADSDDAVKFKKLRQAVDSTLTDAKVFRVGEKSIDVYVAGKTTSGTVGVLHTKSVET